MNQKDKEKILRAGKIASQVREFAKKIVKKDALLIEIAERIELEIIKLGGKPAFPTNLSINDIAAHYTPSHDDKTLAYGLLKVDFGVHIDGFVADTSISFDLEDSQENKKLIKSSEEALENVIKKIKYNISTNEIGKIIYETITKNGFTPIVNLSGHSIEKYDLHSGVTIPNIDDKKNILLDEGVYAIEPFSTKGNGKVYDGKPSGIYSLKEKKSVRSQNAREILEFIENEYSTLPFCSRWIVKKFGLRAILALKELENSGNLHQYAQLIESSHNNVSQAEHTVLIEKDKITITTL